MDWVSIIGYIIAPVSGVVAWFASARKRRNDAIADLQATIDMLVAKNKELYDEVVLLRRENASLRAEVEELSLQLKNIKTITKQIKTPEK
jgi:regulator of replication initiation timing